MNRKFVRYCKNIFKKICVLFIGLGLLVTSLGIPPFIEVLADDNNTKLVFVPTGNTVEIDKTDINKVIIMKDGQQAGSLKIKVYDNYQTPSMNGNNVEFILPQRVSEDYQVLVELLVEPGYEKSGQYTYKEAQYYFPGEGDLYLDITENNVHNFSFTISEVGHQPGGQPYQIFAKFAGVSNPVDADDNGDIFIPEEWTSGNVELYARVCNDNGISPNLDSCQGDAEDLRVDVIMPANKEQINNTVEPRGSGNNSVLYIDEDFLDYGKAVLHLQKEGSNSEDVMDNINLAIVSIVSEDLILVRADAPIEMSYSVGTVDYDSAMLTRIDSGKVAIFFGNGEATLIASGPKVLGIKDLYGAASTEINEDGSVTITFPDLSFETTTRVTITIELTDHSTVTKTLDIARTALALRYNKGDGDGTLVAGYVANKGYLYNNQNHNDEIFDAYLQVILYKDNVVAGYKQIQIDDEDFINSLDSNESGAMEVFSDARIKLYGKALNDTIEGVNRASVFLTDGRIDGDSDVLPSVEFGIGAGVEITWEAE